MPLSPVEIEERAKRALDVPLLRFLDASLTLNSDRTFSIDLPVSERSHNAAGALHGGAIATVLDVAAYLAVLPHLEPDEEAVTHAFAASYMAASSAPGHLQASAHLLRRTRRVAFVLAELSSEGDLIASATVTKSLRQARADSLVTG